MDEHVRNKFFKLLRESHPFFGDRELKRLEKKYGSNLLDLLEALIFEELLSHREVCRLWSLTIGVAYVDPFASVVTREALDILPVGVAKKAQVLGLYVIENVLTVAVADPSDTTLLKRLEGITGLTVSPVFALPSEIRDAIEINYSSDQDVNSIVKELAETGETLIAQYKDHDYQSISESKALIKIVDAIIYFALRERASDIHIESHEEHSVVRFRIDGRMREMLRFARAIHPAVLVRIKIMCDMNIAESRFPQDGRMTMPLGPRKADFRVSVIPSTYGEKAVVRVLASTNKQDFLTLDRMLISRTVVEPFKRVIQNSHGIIFVTGPTGSGKTTTLYAALDEIKSPDVNISTIEDPIEMRLDGITQSQVNNHIDLRFATLLRAMLRQDPDVILVGEIRDLETAKIACEAALTGHLVFATLHTNNAVQAVLRLVEIGLEPYMVAPTIQAVLAQRLAARICMRCKESYFPSQDVLLNYFHDVDSNVDIPFYLGKGCEHCRGTGYHGRVAFHELVLVTEEMRSLISESASLAEVTKAAERAGYRSLRYDGLKKALLGLTTIEEIEKNTSFEWEAG